MPSIAIIMRATKLNLQFFRNHRDLKVQFPSQKDIVVIQGSNGTGKTSILEALYYVSLLKSFRVSQGDDLIFWDQEYFRLELEVEGEAPNDSGQQNPSTQQKLEVFYGKPPHKKRVVKVNEIERPAEYFVGQLKTVLFTPRDLLLFTDQPTLRRTYLNRVLMQVEDDFAGTISRYMRILKQRNALLKAYRKQVRDEELDVWDQELIKYGLPIINGRKNLTDFLNQSLAEEYSKISGAKAKIDFQYHSTAGLSAEEFQANLKKRRYQDMQEGVTGIGPHRDDLMALMNDRPVKNTLSQGELRSFALALKMAEGSYIKHKTSVKPIFLFDDVFSELDQGRQTRLITMLNECQVFITAAEEHCLSTLKQDLEIIKL